MGWLGVCYWLCSPCHVIYVETARPFIFRKAGW